ncbi:Ig-like domain-containing protein [Paenibacillus sp. DMB20]|uniref:Ig-like domain-containing protein n=1 Tax=Paenibacillus sp. DMB20 TaxID=1642570 RepID=UPI00069CA651|nr:Ig-like domain-containing protein [Paenibacillus sp. DMB20]
MFKIKSGSAFMSLCLVISMTFGVFATGGGVQAQAANGDDNPLVSVRLTAAETNVPLDGVTHLQVIGKLKDGSEIDLRNDSKATIEYSAPAEMFTIEKDGTARAGTYDVGDVKVGVKVSREGGTFTDKLTMTIRPEPARPFLRDYARTLTMKLYLGDNGNIELTLDEALDAIKKMDQLTRGMPKIIYLVGWQHDGHDSKYPDWNVVNTKLKRAGDETALDSMKWFMDEAEKYNTTISFHINMTDAYMDSPQWKEFVDKDLIRKEENGDLIKGGHWVSGQSYRINLTRAWEAGVLQRNIDDLLAGIPQLLRGRTIHIDAFITSLTEVPVSDGYADPYHKTTHRQETETQKEILRYWRDKGMDVTSEYFHAYRVNPLFGLQPMAWWADWRSIDSQLKLPAALAVGGKGGDELFGTSMHGEDIVRKDKVRLTGFLREFSTTTLLWQYLNQFDRLSYDSSTNTVHFSNHVTSSKQEGKRIVKQGDVLIADGTNMFVPALWRNDEPEIMAYSQDGYTDRSWKLPADWAGVQAVDVYEIGPGLPRLMSRGMTVVDGTVTLSLPPDTGVYIAPASADPLDPIQDIATGIKTVPTPAKDAIRLTLPAVPEGYEIQLLESKRPNIIDHTGKITPTTQEEEVLLVFQVKRTADGVFTHTAAIPVIVPSGSANNIKDVYDPKDAILTGNTLLRSSDRFMTGSALGFVGGEAGNNNTAAFQNIIVPGDGVYDLQIEYATAEPRSVFVRANEEEGIEVPLTGTDWNTALHKTIRIELRKGLNTITLYNPAKYAPDMGALTVMSISPHTIAETIAAIQPPAKNDKMLTLPSVPPGFSIAIKSTDNEAIIHSDGTIKSPAAEETVHLILEVTRSYDGATAETVLIPVLVPGKSLITSLSPVRVSTVVGTPPIMPSVVTATYSDLTTTEVPVVWDAIEADQYAKAGTFTVSGTVADTELQAVAAVTVTNEPAETPYITKLAPIFVNTVVGTPPVMPSVVTATYSDLATAEVPVVWDSIDSSQYSKVGAFKVKGTVEGTTIPGEAHVTVKSKEEPGSGYNNGNPGGSNNGSGSSSNSGASTFTPLPIKEPDKPKPEGQRDSEPKIMELPYELTADQLKKPGVVSVVRVNKDGTTTPIIFSFYDPAAKRVKFIGSPEEKYEVVHTAKKFTDLVKHSWAEEAIETLASRGVLHGVSLNRFAPELELTRAELVVMLVRMFNFAVETDSNFDDVSRSATYYKEIAIAKKLGLVHGVTDTEFHPEAKVTREQLITIVERILRQEKLIAISANVNELTGFADREQIADFAQHSATMLVKLKLVVGANKQLFPKKTTSRAEAAVVLYRIIPLVLQDKE